ncbi:MAG: phage tail protein [Sphingomonas sp.]
MTDGGSYRFTTPGQWRRCLTMAIAERGDLRPEDGVETARWPGPAGGFAVTPDGGLLWIGRDGALRAEGDCAGPLLGRVQRLTPGKRVTWVLDDTGLQRFDAATLQRLGILDLTGVSDIAGADRDGLRAITGEGLVHLDADGRILAGPAAIPRADRIAAYGATVALLDLTVGTLTLQAGSTALTVDLRTILGSDAPVFEASDLSSAPSGFCLAGEWNGAPGFLLLDDAGEPSRWGVWSGSAPVAIACAGDDLVALFDTGNLWTVRRFPGGGGAGGRMWLTPVLESDTLEGKWLRAELRALLPDGATLALRWAASRDTALRSFADMIAADETRLKGDRIRDLSRRLDWSSLRRSFVGEARDGDSVVEDFSFPLDEVDGSFLWLEVTLDANSVPGQAGVAPRIDSLAVVHDSPRLIDYLPAVFRGPDGDQDHTFSRLLAVFEAVSQGIDGEIGALADRLDPARTEARRLPGLAALLGLPFDVTLPEAAQRGLIAAAPALLAGRGTRRGMLALLEAVLGERGYRVIDRSEEFAAVTLGGGGLAGSRLPGFLTGPSIRTPMLSARLVLGRTALCPPDPSRPGQVARGAGVAGRDSRDRRERRRWGSAIERLVAAMVPAGVRLRVRWIDLNTAAAGDLPAIADTTRPLALGDRARSARPAWAATAHSSSATATCRSPSPAMKPKEEKAMSCDTPALKTATRCGPCSPSERNRYFRGKKLTVADFELEQDYLIERRRLINRAMLGWGVIEGFGIKLAEAGITVDPGMALDARGRELVACEPVDLTAPGDLVWLVKGECGWTAGEPPAEPENDKRENDKEGSDGERHRPPLSAPRALRRSADRRHPRRRWLRRRAVRRQPCLRNGGLFANPGMHARIARLPMPARASCRRGGGAALVAGAAGERQPAYCRDPTTAARTINWSTGASRVTIRICARGRG